MASVEETKSGKVILICDCGIEHTLKLNDDDEIEIKSKYVKENKETKEDKENVEQPKKRNGIFRK